jgi:hypothetical protein
VNFIRSFPATIIEVTFTGHGLRTIEHLERGQRELAADLFATMPAARFDGFVEGRRRCRRRVLGVHQRRLVGRRAAQAEPTRAPASPDAARLTRERPMSKKSIREIPFKQIENWFRLASYYFGDKFCPAVDKNDSGSHLIRVIKRETVSGAHRNTSYDYFELEADGTVLVASRGYAKGFKPARITGLAEAVERYSAPDESTVRMRFF